MKNKKENFLRLVTSDYTNTSVKYLEEKKYDSSLQVDMFASSVKNTILVIYFSDIDGKLFSDAIKNVHPKYILDMRLNPRFDIAGYSRKLAFGEFNQLGSKYMDYMELVGESGKSKNHLIEAAERIIKNAKIGPVVFLFGKKEQDEIYEEKLIHKLPIDKNKWILAEIP